jgi:hypothetical protein
MLVRTKGWQWRPSRRYLSWYRAAARICRRLRWEVLAGIGTIESDNGRSNVGVARGMVGFG